MPRLVQYEAIHNVYGPAHRKVKYPSADWAFLVQVARNVAAAFDTIHAHGHVIGDVNQGNVCVGTDARVRLIDCDSFQIAAPGALYRCEVGVPHFTAPELLCVESFRDLRRNEHHDNFGLAVLIFHVLFMGRHPFAGVYTGRQDMPIERAIREFRYAFGRMAQARDMARPPGSIGPEIATAELAGLFERAFGHSESKLGRPQARHWVQALESLQRNIRTCGEQRVHRYCGKLIECPWCRLEKSERLVFFVGVQEVALAAPRGFSLRAAWKQIEAEASKLVPVPLPVDPSNVNVVGAGLSLAVQAARIVKMVFCGLAIIVPLFLIFRLPVGTLIWSLAGFHGWNLAKRWPSPFDLERERRKVALAVAEQRWKTVERCWDELAGTAESQRKLRELRTVRHEYQQLRCDYDKARCELQATVRQQQLQRFLVRFQIDTANLPHLGASQKLRLAACGIATAADIEARRLQSVQGVSREVIDQLWHWRCELERWSQLEPTRHAAAADLKALGRQFTQRRRQLAGTLSAAPGDFRQLAANFARQRQACLPAAQQAADALAQARANMAVFD